ncbi:MAG TPA: histidine triad nucleotide-binding protein [Dissulfurispiraceae bacterium]|nr:histidine triad nucleotide-binding protein [Dissulfurispiraceae bacterium]
MSDCIFCKIAEKKIPAKIVYEDEHALAFEDVNPQAPVHILVIPKRHIPTMVDTGDGDKELMGHLMGICKKLAIDKGIAERGFRIVSNTNPDGGQVVYHFHLHMLGGRKLHGPLG